jgi:hypothetical protein
MSAAIKALDPHHMVTTGVEGFFGPSTPELLAANPYNGNEGTDFSRHHRLDTIDFAVAHGAAGRALLRTMQRARCGCCAHASVVSDPLRAALQCGLISGSAAATAAASWHLRRSGTPRTCRRRSASARGGCECGRIPKDSALLLLTLAMLPAAQASRL